MAERTSSMDADALVPRARDAGRSGFDPALEAVRGLAALAVLSGHAYGWSHLYAASVSTTVHGRFGRLGGFALVLFFALSGYLLFRPFVRAAVQGTRVDVRRYAVSRLLRILPTYWLVIAVYLVVLDHGIPRREWWRYPLLIQGFWKDTVATVDGPAWTLAVEAQFYLLLPLIAWLLLRRGPRVAAALLVVAGLGLGVLRQYTINDGHVHDARWTYSLPGNAVFFVPGMLLAIIAELMVRRISSLAGMVLTAVGLGCFVLEPFHPSLDQLTTLGSGLLLASVVLPRGPTPVTRALRWRPVVFLGTVSYGVYLWHEPLVHHLRGHVPGGSLGLFVVGGAVAIALAAVTHYAVEAPFLRLRSASVSGDAPWWRRPGPALAGLGVGLLVLVVPASVIAAHAREHTVPAVVPRATP